MPTPGNIIPLCTLVGLVLTWTAGVRAEDEKKEEKKQPPHVLLVAPLAAVRGQAAELTVRGLRLEDASGVRFVNTDAAVQVEIKSKGKANVPGGQDVKIVGDTEVKLVVTVPDDVAADRLDFVVASEAGESQPHTLLLFGPGAAAAEHEPNGGFSQANAVEPGKTIIATIGRERDVDVFRIEGKAGATLSAQVLAARHGSGLDALLTVFDAAGRIIAAADDTAESRDAALRVKLPRDGAYYLTVMDANDNGGPAHVYLLQWDLSAE